MRRRTMGGGGGRIISRALLAAAAAASIAAPVARASVLTEMEKPGESNCIKCGALKKKKNQRRAEEI